MAGSLAVTLNLPVLAQAVERVFAIASRPVFSAHPPAVELRLLADDTLELAATSAGVSIYERIPVIEADYDLSDQIVVDERFRRAIKQCHSGPVTIDAASDGPVTVAAPRMAWTLQQLEVELPFLLPSDPVLERLAKPFLAALQAMLLAIPQAQVRPTFDFIEFRDDCVRASDGQRFHELPFLFHVPFRLPGRAAAELVRLMRGEDHFRMAFDTTTITFAFGKTLLVVSKGSEQGGLSLQSLYPTLAQPHPPAAVVDQSQLLDAISTVKVTADRDNPAIVLMLSALHCALACYDRAGNHSSRELDVELSHAEGDEHTIAVDIDHFRSALLACGPGAAQLVMIPDHRRRPGPLVVRNALTGFFAILPRVALPG